MIYKINKTTNKLKAIFSDYAIFDISYIVFHEILEYVALCKISENIIILLTKNESNLHLFDHLKDDSIREVIICKNKTYAYILILIKYHYLN